MSEIWKNIEGFDGKYQVSNQGRVRSMWRNNQYKTHAYGYKFHFVQQGHISPEEVLKQLDDLFNEEIKDEDLEK